MNRAEISANGVALAHSMAIFELQTWHLFVGHAWLQCCPLVEGDNVVSPFGSGMTQHHTDWFRANGQWEVVELVALVWWICHLL
jgi:hypothetical protein